LVAYETNVAWQLARETLRLRKRFAGQASCDATGRRNLSTGQSIVMGL